MTYAQLLSYFAARSRVDDSRFSRPGGEECVIDAVHQVFFACDGTPINTGRALYRARDGADRAAQFPTARALFEAPIYGGKSIRERWDEIKWELVDGMPADAFEGKLNDLKEQKP